MLPPETNNASASRSEGVVMLGGFRMPATNQEADGPSRDERIESALALLGQVLQIIDGLEDCDVVGARLQGIIDALRLESDS